MRAALGHPVLRDGRREAAERDVRVGRVGLERLREPQAGEHRRLRLECEVGQHRGHRGLVDEELAERRAAAGVPHRLGDRLTHPRRRAEHAVQTRALHHLDDRAHAAARLAEQHPDRAVELDLGGGVRPVAELVLESLDAEARCACRCGSIRGTNRHVSPSSTCPRRVWASTRKPSDIGAEQNHLCPVSW